MKTTTTETMARPVRFLKHYVTNGIKKARVHYSAFAMNSTGQKCVTLYAKGYEDGAALAEILPQGFEDNTDIMTDYFEKGRARIIEGDALYPAALAMTAVR